jgi:hypothetical protein
LKKIEIFLILLFLFLIIIAGSRQVLANQSQHTPVTENMVNPGGQTKINGLVTPGNSSRIGENTPIATVTANIPGLIPADAVLFLEDRQFRCKEIKDLPGTYHWDCLQEGKTALIEVEIFTKSLDRVDLIDTNFHQDGEPQDAAAIEVFQMFSEMPFSNESWGNVQAWLLRTLPTMKLAGDIRSITIDGIQYRVYGTQEDRSFEIGYLD